MGLCICQKKPTGDLDGDGKTSISDVTKLLNAIAGENGFADQRIADFDGDGKTSISDVTKLLNVIAGRDTL